MTAVLIGVVWLITLAEVFRIGYILGEKKRKPSRDTTSEKQRIAAEKAARELNNMLTYDGNEQ